MSVTCRKVGNSLTATIPNEIVNILGIVPGDELEVTENGKSIIFTPVKKKLRGELFLEQYYGKPYDEIGTLETEEVDWGKPQGDEEW